MRRSFQSVTVLCVGIVIGLAISVGHISRAADTQPVTPVEKRAPSDVGTTLVKTGVVMDGEHVPIPPDADTGTIQVFLSIREIQDNNEILGRLECYLEPDGRTAHVRNVNKFTGEIVATGTANYALFHSR